jgi:hypothetical protein
LHAVRRGILRRNPQSDGTEARRDRAGVTGADEIFARLWIIHCNAQRHIRFRSRLHTGNPGGSDEVVILVKAGDGMIGIAIASCVLPLIRVPLTTGLPARIRGSAIIRSW